MAALEVAQAPKGSRWLTEATLLWRHMRDLDREGKRASVRIAYLRLRDVMEGVPPSLRLVAGGTIYGWDRRVWLWRVK